MKDQESTAIDNVDDVLESERDVAKFKDKYTEYVDNIQTKYNDAMDDDSGDEDADNEAAMDIAIAALQELEGATLLLENGSKLMDKVKGLFDDCRDQSHWANEFSKDASTLLEEAMEVQRNATDTTNDHTLAELKAFLPVVEYLLESANNAFKNVTGHSEYAGHLH